MIKKEEIEAKSNEFKIHTAHVERDYVFGWLLVGIYTVSPLKDVLILKGGNCFRKAYFANTRFSAFRLLTKDKLGYNIPKRGYHSY